MYNKINMDLECDQASSMSRKDEISGSTSIIKCANGLTAEENSELNVSNKPLDIEQSDIDQNIDNSDSESTVTIGEISADEYYDEIAYGKKPVVHEELYSTDQYKQSGSSHYVNVVNNDGSNNSYGENPSLISNIRYPLPTYAQVNRLNREHNRQNTHDQHTYRQSLEPGLTIIPKVCHRQACNNLVLPLRPRDNPRKAAVGAAAKISKSFTKRKDSIPQKRATLYYSCGHREKIKCRSLKQIGIKTPMTMQVSRSLDERLMTTSFYLLTIPAALTVDQILKDFKRKANWCSDDDISMDLIITAFNEALPARCLYYIEKLQYEEVIQKYRNRKLTELYGLIHLFRFIGYLPKLYTQMEPNHIEFQLRCTPFINRLIDYMDAENLCVYSERGYFEHVMPTYFRKTYCNIPNRT